MKKITAAEVGKNIKLFCAEPVFFNTKSTRIYALELVSLLLEQISYEKEQVALTTGAHNGLPYGVLEQLEVLSYNDQILTLWLYNT